MPSHASAEATETTSLLSGKPNPPNNTENPALEDGAVEDADVNPLFKGDPAALRKLVFLVPALGFGVSFL